MWEVTTDDQTASGKVRAHPESCDKAARLSIDGHVPNLEKDQNNGSGLHKFAEFRQKKKISVASTRRQGQPSSIR